MNLSQELVKLRHLLHASHEHALKIERQIRELEDKLHHPLPRTGIDYAFPPHPPADKLRHAGVSFACRYLTGSEKALTRNEAKVLSEHGIDIVAIYETTGNRTLEGTTAGEQDAMAAHRALSELKPTGNPFHEYPVYFAEDDFEPTTQNVGKILDYIRGATGVLTWHRVGLYGGYEAVLEAHRQNVCKYFWQTYAWSHGQWLAAAQLRQVQNGIKIYGADCDLDHAMAADFGQFRV